MFRSRNLIVALLLVGFPSLVFACLWDYDTIKMERIRFPSTLELITGKFLRHSPEFYQWRITNRQERLAKEPTNVALLDDLAVAYDKTGQHEKAIEIALKTEQIKPGRYETAANLATFYIHAGKVADSIPHIDRALKINPNAHFGRERYQKILVEYLLTRPGKGAQLPLAKVETELNAKSHVRLSETFASYISSLPNHQELRGDNNQLVVKGILGMMRFANFNSPILVEALASLLTDLHGKAVDADDPDAKLLAARALLKASYEVKTETARHAYRAMAERALLRQTPRTEPDQISLATVEDTFKKELAEADAWYAQLRSNELNWIKEGKNPDVEFYKLYTTEPEVGGMEVTDPMRGDELAFIRIGLSLGTAFLIGLVLIIVVWMFIRRRSSMVRS